MSFNVQEVLFLSYLPRFGPVLIHEILGRYQNFAAFLSDSELHSRLADGAVQAIHELQKSQCISPLWSKAESELEQVYQLGGQVISIHDNGYPPLLSEIHSAPPILSIRGNLEALSLPQIAIVGSRKTTKAGLANAAMFAKELARCGLAITSGLALGVDAAAHCGALEVGGTTIAVVGTGIDSVYPKRNTRLHHQIVEMGGAIVSEFPLGVQPSPQNFPKRNRTISGLCVGTLVIEAALKSGSLITAKYALEQNREVFAIPGSIHNPLARGCHSLIKQGAKLVEQAQDIADELEGLIGFYQQEPRNVANDQSTISLNDGEKVILNYIQYDSVSIDDLVEHTGLPIGEVMSGLVQLELNGLIALEGTGYIRVSA